MSDIGSGAPPGARPVGQGPRRVTSAFRPVEEKKHDHDKKGDKDHKGNDRKDGAAHAFSVQVDSKLFHLKAGETIAGKIVAIESSHRLAIQNADGLFAIEGDLTAAGITPQVGTNAAIIIDTLQPTMRGSMNQLSGQPLPRPILVLITILELYHGTGQDGAPTAASNAPAENYTAHTRPIKTSSTNKGPASSDSVGADDPSVLLTRCAAPLARGPSAKAQTTKGPKMAISSQDMASLITANEISEHDIKPANAKIQPTSKADQANTHDHWATVERLLGQYRYAFPDTADDVEKNIRGALGNIPDGLSLFLGGLIFASPDQWVGPLMAEYMDESPALEELRRDFFELRDTFLAAADKNWRLFLVPHPEEALDKKLEIIGRLTMIDDHDQETPMRTIASRQHYQSLGPVQIEAVIAPDMIDIAFHLSSEAPKENQDSIQRLVTIYFRRAGLNGTLRFEPLGESKIAYGVIAEALKKGLPIPR